MNPPQSDFFFFLAFDIEKELVSYCKYLQAR